MTTILTTDIRDQLAMWLRIVRVKALSNLNAVVMIQRDLTHNNIEVEDEVSSLILIDPEGTKVSLFTRRNLDAGRPARRGDRWGRHRRHPRPPHRTDTGDRDRRHG